jgi:nucleoside-diphosphate-sugar epimerase
MKTAMVRGTRGFVGRLVAKELAARGYRCTIWHLSTDDMLRHLSVTDFASNFDFTAHCAYHVGGRAAIAGNCGSLAKNLLLDPTLFDCAVRWLWWRRIRKVRMPAP